MATSREIPFVLRHGATEINDLLAGERVTRASSLTYDPLLQTNVVLDGLGGARRPSRSDLIHNWTSPTGTFYQTSPGAQDNKQDDTQNDT
jgi:hypothetical protein